LIAELASVFLAGELGLPNSENLTNHAAYLQNWLRGMGDDPRFVFKAAAQASKAVNYLLSFNRAEDHAKEPEEVAVA
jgi:antirestriction protein ArdC